MKTPMDIATMTAMQQCRARVDQEIANLLEESRAGYATEGTETILSHWIDLLAELSDKTGEDRGRREMLASFEIRLNAAGTGNA